MTVKRTIPEGAVATSDVQTVYVRTLNGTAYGTTPEMINEEGQDKFHFAHTNQAEEGNGYLVFGPDSAMEQTIAVFEKDLDFKDRIASNFRIGQTNRYYFVQIYKVQTNGGLNGQIDAQQGKEKRVMPLSTYELTADAYNYDANKRQAYFDDGTTTKKTRITGKIYTETIRAVDFVGQALSDYAAAANLGFDITLNASVEQAVKAQFKKGGHEESFHPNLNPDATYPEGNNFVMQRTAGLNEETVQFAANKAGNVTLLDWKVKLQPKAPGYLGVSPLAATAYAAGDEIMITAVYNQVIASVDTTNGVPVLDLSGTDFGAYFEDFEYVDDGAGTNTLVFKTTAKKDITPEEILRINAFFVENSGWWANNGKFVAKVANLNGDVTE